MNSLLLFFAIYTPLIYLETRRRVGLKISISVKLHSLAWFLLTIPVIWIVNYRQATLMETFLWIGFVFSIVFAVCGAIVRQTPIIRPTNEMPEEKLHSTPSFSPISSLVLLSACSWLPFILGKNREVSLDNQIFYQCFTTNIFLTTIFCVQELLIYHFTKMRR